MTDIRQTSAVSCHRFREALSARLDGEELGLDEALLRAHLHRCSDCREWEVEASHLDRLVRLSSLPQVPDQTQAILDQLE